MVAKTKNLDVTEAPNAIIPDTSTLIHDPEAIKHLREGGNILFIPLTVLMELDQLKERPDIGIDARDAARRIEAELEKKDGTVILLKTFCFDGLDGLDSKIPDHRIIAAANLVKRGQERSLTNGNGNGGAKKKRPSIFDCLPALKFKSVKLISRDRTMRILAKEYGINAENYMRDQVKVVKIAGLVRLNVKFDDVYNVGKIFCFDFDSENKSHASIRQNEGAVCFSDWRWGNVSEQWSEAFAVIRRGNRFEIIPPDISAFGITSFSLNEENGRNWAQDIALYQLLHEDIKLVFLQGGAGSGKTLLAIATALEQKSKFRQIVVSRPMIAVGGDDKMGFMPGDMKQKMAPWMIPIWQSLRFIKEVDQQKKMDIDKLFESGKITIQPLDYIRGMTFIRCLVIVDDAQNLTPHMIKTIITRAGNHTKVVFTGDVGQIDVFRRLDEKSNGLTYAIDRMHGRDIVATCQFSETVRSDLANLAEELL